MNYPARYASLNLVAVDASGRPLPEAWDVFYPPPGFVEMKPFAIGNGDVYGFYWPIGLEEREPIVVSTAHDGWAMVVEASSFERLLGLHWANGHYDLEDVVFDRDVLSQEEISELLAEHSVRFYTDRLGLALPPRQEEWSVPQLLALDDASPALLLQAAHGLFARGHVSATEAEQCEKYLRRALQVLPEFADASFALSNLLRRVGDIEEAASVAVEGLCSPPSFSTRWDDRLKALAWLQSLRDEQAPRLTDDPLWRGRARLSLKSGEKFNDDFALYEESIAKYLEQARGARAIRLRVTVGELMSSETSSFRERCFYSGEKHLELLRREIEVAQLQARLPLIP